MTIPIYCFLRQSYRGPTSQKKTLLVNVITSSSRQMEFVCDGSFVLLPSSVINIALLEVSEPNIPEEKINEEAKRVLKN